MNMLQLIQQAVGEMGLAVPALVIGNTDTQVQQYLYLLNGLGSELTREYPWQGLQKQNIFTVTYTTVTGDTTLNSSTLTNVSSTAGIDSTYQIAGTGLNQATFVSSVTVNTISLSQPATSSNTGVTFNLCKVRYSLPSDYDRPINNTHWDKSRHWQMLGPETAQQWEWLISGYIATGPRIRYRIFNNYFQIWPMVATTEVLGFEYVGSGWVNSAAGVSKTAFTVDTDTCMFPDRLMVTGLKLKYFEIKGFDTTNLRRDYDRHLSIAKAGDGQSPDLSMNPRAAMTLIGWNNIPDSGYGS